MEPGVGWYVSGTQEQLTMKAALIRALKGELQDSSELRKAEWDLRDMRALVMDQSSYVAGGAYSWVLMFKIGLWCGLFYFRVVILVLLHPPCHRPHHRQLHGLDHLLNHNRVMSSFLFAGSKFIGNILQGWKTFPLCSWLDKVEIF
jgi:hypothetical protein